MLFAPITARSLARPLAGLMLAWGLALASVPAPYAFAAPKTAETKPKKAKPKKTKKKPAQRGLKARGKGRPSAKTLVARADQEEASAVKPRHVMIVVVGLALIVLLVRHRREEEDAAAPERDLSQMPAPSDRGGHVPRAVVLDSKGAVDPLVMSDTQANEPTQEQENAAAAEEIDRLTTGDMKLKLSEHGSPASGSPAGNAPVAPRAAAGDRLPGAFGAHFDALHNETMQWTAPFRVPGVSNGEIGITNFRVVVVHEERKLTMFPPSYRRELRRHQMALPTITRADESAVKRPAFLVAGLVTLLAYPVGTALSCVAIGCYFALLRPVLEVTIGSGLHRQRRHYPLIRSDIVEARRILPQASSLSENQKKAG